MITHDLSTAAHFADRIAVMYLGRIVEEGPAKEVVRNPQHPYTKALISVVPKRDPRDSTVPHAAHRRDAQPGAHPARAAASILAARWSRTLATRSTPSCARPRRPSRSIIERPAS